MKNRELFERTVKILVDAYRSDTLEHSNCYACAVGNLVAANNGIGIECKMGDDGAAGLSWSDRASMYTNEGVAYNNWFALWRPAFESVIPEEVRKLARKEILSTGYTLDECIQIEYAFENVIDNGDPDEYMLNGLLAVYDTLCEIHQVDMKEVEAGELVFTK